MVGARGLPAEILGLGPDRVDQAGRQRPRRRDPGGLEVLGEDRRGGAIGGADVRQPRRLGRLAHRVVVDHEVRHDPLGELRVAGPGLAVDQREVLVVAPLQVPQMRQLQLQAAHHLPVLGPPDHAAVGDRRPAPEAPPEDQRQHRGRRQGVRVGVVVGEYQPAGAGRSGFDLSGEGGESRPRLVARHRVRILASGPPPLRYTSRAFGRGRPHEKSAFPLPRIPERDAAVRARPRPRSARPSTASATRPRACCPAAVRRTLSRLPPGVLVVGRGGRRRGGPGVAASGGSATVSSASGSRACCSPRGSARPWEPPGSGSSGPFRSATRSG